MRLVFVVERLGKPSETFIRREIVALSRARADFLVYALHAAQTGDVETPKELAGRIRVAPALWSPRTVAAKLRWALTHPVTFAGILGLLPEALRAGAAGLGELFVGAGRAYALASLVADSGAGRIHAQFATSPATAALIASRLAGVPFSVSVHAHDIFAYKTYRTHRTYTTMLGLKLRSADVVVACSEAARRQAVSLGAAESKSVLVHHGLELGEFPFAAERPQSPPFRVLAVGRLVPKKGFEFLVRALALLAREDAATEIRCTIVGSGPLEGALRRLAGELGLGGAMELAGELPEAGVARILGECHVLCAPSVVLEDGDRDGIPNVVIEAMARGTPVVATDAGGLPEVVRDGATGLVVPQRSSRELARAIRRMAEDRALAARLAQSARALVEQEFDAERNAGRLRELLWKERAEP